MVDEPVVLEGDLNISTRYMDPATVRAKLYNLIYNGGDKIRGRILKRFIDSLVASYYEYMPSIDASELSRAGVYSYLIPVESLESRMPPELAGVNGPGDIYSVSEYLKGTTVSSYDSSWHTGGAHFIMSFVVLNTGYYFYTFGGGGGSGAVPRMVFGVPDDWDNDIEIKLHESRVAEALSGALDGDHRFIFLDESLNMIYTVKWSRNKRERYIEIVRSILSKVISDGAIPIGVFYTKARDVAKTIESAGHEVDVFIPDKALMDRVLSRGERSPLFRVHNTILDDYGLEILCFYLKVGDRNILRVEFPSEALRHASIDDIHRAVYVDAVRGGGYPYTLMRAHEMAVLDSEDREAIENALAEVLDIPMDLIYSMKQISKWRSIA